MSITPNYGEAERLPDIRYSHYENRWATPSRDQAQEQSDAAMLLAMRLFPPGSVWAATIPRVKGLTSHN